MKEKVFILYIGMILLVGGCYDDKGNYDYTDIGDITITGIENSYTAIALAKKLEIKPTVTSKNPEDTFEYLWTVYNPNYYDSYLTEAIKVDTIGREKDLSYEVNLQQGSYTLVYTVKNVNNNYTVYRKIPLTVSTQFNEGFYMLKETESGDTELDLCLNDDTHNDNLLAKSLGAPMSGAPTRLGIYFNYSFVDEETGKYAAAATLGVMTEKDISLMSTGDMRLIYNHNSMFYYSTPPVEIPYYICQVSFCVVYISSEGVYASMQYVDNNSWGTGKFGFVRDIAGEHRGSRYALFSPKKSAVICFDAKNGRFLAVDYNGFLHAFKEDASGKSPNNISHELIFMGLNRINSVDKVYAIFVDEKDVNQRYLYQLEMPSSTQYTNPVKEIVTLPANLKLNSADLYATNRTDTRAIYMVNNNRLYFYDVDNQEESPLNPEGLPADETITYLEHKYWSQPNDAEHNFNYLMIGTYKSGNYKVYMYEMLGGKPMGQPKRVIEGKGKVVDLQYVSPKMRGSSRSYYPL